MKKLIALSLLLIASLIGKAQLVTDTTDVYLQRKPFDALSITTDGNNVFISGKSVCGVFGKGDLNIRCNATTGVHLDSTTGELFIPEYYEFNLKNVCTGQEIGAAYKEEFYLETHGLEIPYAMNFNTGYSINYVKLGMFGYDPAEWDTICKYGQPSGYTIWSPSDNAWVPDTALAYRPFLQDLDPYADCATNVQAGFSDTYYNQDTIFGVPDGFYYFTEEINLPGTIYDPGMYPNSWTIIIEKQGNQILTSQALLPPCCSYSSAPETPAHLRITHGNRLEWDAATSATSYNVYRALAYQDHGWAYYVPAQLVASSVLETYYLIPQSQEHYFYFVCAVNCIGESVKSIGKRDN